jgi:hypothetical protein
MKDNLRKSIEGAKGVLQGASGPKKNRRWQRIDPPSDPRGKVINPSRFSGGGGPAAGPVPVHIGFPLPQRPLPPVNVAVDALNQFNKPVGVPTRRVSGPSPFQGS